LRQADQVKGEHRDRAPALSFSGFDFVRYPPHHRTQVMWFISHAEHNE
jgi:hypothetical protein